MPNEIPPVLAQSGLLRAASDPDGASAWKGSNVLAHRADSAGNVGADSIRLCILGEPASKANSRQLLKLGGRIRSVKSDKAIAYVQYAIRQVILQCRAVKWECLNAGQVRVTMTIHYASERPDLDESLILDSLQKFVYGNDRQVREKHVYHAIDKANPRTEILIEALS
jgi:Holliday junction resolvase RusA-like endonuclease